jgi:hypothetical protein
MPHRATAPCRVNCARSAAVRFVPHRFSSHSAMTAAGAVPDLAGLLQKQPAPSFACLAKRAGSFSQHVLVRRANGRGHPSSRRGNFGQCKLPLIPIPLDVRIRAVELAHESSAQVIIAACTDGRFYVKGPPCLDGNQMLLCEWIGTQLANEFGLQTLHYGVMRDPVAASRDKHISLILVGKSAFSRDVPVEISYPRVEHNQASERRPVPNKGEHFLTPFPGKARLRAACKDCIAPRC